jgi:hypothetical protein
MHTAGFFLQERTVCPWKLKVLASGKYFNQLPLSIRVINIYESYLEVRYTY